MQESKQTIMKEVYLSLNSQPFSLETEAKCQNLRVWYLGRSQEVQVQVPMSGVQVQQVTTGWTEPVIIQGSCTVSDFAPRLCPSLLSFCSPSDLVWRLEVLFLSQTQPGYPELGNV